MFNNDYFHQIAKTEKPNVGQVTAYRAWEDSVENKTDVLEIRELPWGRDLKDGAMVQLVETLRDAGVKTFIVTDASTALMEEIAYLCAAGAKIVGPALSIRHPKYWGDEQRNGLLFTI